MNKVIQDTLALMEHQFKTRTCVKDELDLAESARRFTATPDACSRCS